MNECCESGAGMGMGVKELFLISQHGDRLQPVNKMFSVSQVMKNETRSPLSSQIK